MVFTCILFKTKVKFFPVPGFIIPGNLIPAFKIGPGIPILGIKPYGLWHTDYLKMFQKDTSLSIHKIEKVFAIYIIL